MHHSPELNCTCEPQGHQTGLSTDLRQGLGVLAATVSRWHATSRQRQALADLDSHLLADIGVTRSAANRDADKPFWS